MTPSPFDPEDFKAGMRRLASGVSLIAVDDGTARHGLIATAVTSLSAEPPSLLVCVNGTASIFPAISEAGSFCVNILSCDQKAIAERFAIPKDRESRFESGSWTTLATGAPALEGSQVSFDCRAAGRTEFGTHTIFFGEVVAVTDWGTEADPLLYHGSAFHGLQALSKKVA